MQESIPSQCWRARIQVGNRSTVSTLTQINLVRGAHGLNGQRMFADRGAHGLWVRDSHRKTGLQPYAPASKVDKKYVQTHIM